MVRVRLVSCACRGFDHSGIDLRRPVLWYDGSMHARGLRGAQEGAEVIDILKGVKDEEKRWFVFAFRLGKDIV